MNKTILVFGLVLALSAVALARESTEIVSARYLGMGGCFVTVANDRTLLFANPAAIDRVGERMIAVMGIASTVNSKTFDVLGFGLDRRKDFENLDDMSEEEQNNFFDDIVHKINYKRMNLTLSTMPFGWIQKPLGGALFTDTHAVGMAFEGASGTPLVDVVGTQDFGGIVCCGGGLDGIPSVLPHRISMGAGLKYINRSVYSMRETMTELADGQSSELMNGSTIGLDLGLLYDVNPGLRVGLAVYDAFASEIEWDGDASVNSRIQPGDKQKIEPSLRLGVTYNLPWRVQHVSSAIVAFDLAEPFDSDVTFFKKIHMGAEASLFRSWFKARVGISQGYPSIGLGIWGLNYAYYAAEDGRHAGQISDRRHVISFGL
jgi:hypothetical protein